VAYRVTQVQHPTRGQFQAALAEAGLDWPYDDLLESHRHPGVRFEDGVVGLVLHVVAFDADTDHVEVVQAATVLGPDRGVIARWEGDGLDGALDHEAESREDAICDLVELMHDAAADAITDLEERVDDLEGDILEEDGRREVAHLVGGLERELVSLRRSVMPMVEALDKLGRKVAHGGPTFDAWRARYERLAAQMEDIDNLLTSVLGVNLTLVTVRQNEDMRKIAAWAAIGIAPTALAGIWGMNFEHMPELEWSIGYPMALAIIAVVCFSLYRFFRKVGWL
jgi:magnesium transporter